MQRDSKSINSRAILRLLSQKCIFGSRSDGAPSSARHQVVPERESPGFVNHYNSRNVFTLMWGRSSAVADRELISTSWALSAFPIFALSWKLSFTLLQIYPRRAAHANTARTLPGSVNVTRTTCTNGRRPSGRDCYLAFTRDVPPDPRTTQSSRSIDDQLKSPTGSVRRIHHARNVGGRGPRRSGTESPGHQSSRHHLGGSSPVFPRTARSRAVTRTSRRPGRIQVPRSYSRRSLVGSDGEEVRDDARTTSLS